MENANPASNPITEADQLPEVDSLPDGFVDSTSEKSLVPETQKDEEEKPEFTDYKDEKLVEPDRRPELVIDDLHLGKSPAVSSESEECKPNKEIMGSETAGSSCEGEQSLGKCNFLNQNLGYLLLPLACIITDLSVYIIIIMQK